jgi:hypothetical protein
MKKHHGPRIAPQTLAVASGRAQLLQVALKLVVDTGS